MHVHVHALTNYANISRRSEESNTPMPRQDFMIENEGKSNIAAEKVRYVYLI